VVGRQYEGGRFGSRGVVDAAERGALDDSGEALPPPRLLIVDSDVALRETLARALVRLSFVVEVSVDAAAALRCIRTGSVDMVIIDPSHWNDSASDVCRKIRTESDVAILIVTAGANSADQVAVLDAGADDYVTKPFAEAVVVGRVRAILRRTQRYWPVARSVTQVGDLEVDLACHRVRVAGSRVALTLSESRLLALLVQQPGRVYTRREILEHLWESCHVGDERACDAHISHLRRKLERDPGDPQRIVTVRGRGYALVPSGSPLEAGGLAVA
jgi:DNA-binding response OmpR family regulator